MQKPLIRIARDRLRNYLGEKIIVYRRFDSDFYYLGSPIWKHILFRTEWLFLAFDALWKAFGPVKDIGIETSMYLPMRAKWWKLVESISEKDGAAKCG